MNKPAIAIIDGTGPWSNDTYDIAMASSFCNQLSQAALVNYERGPSGDGYRIRERAKRACDFILTTNAKTIALAGYSRGGSAVVMAADMLNRHGKRVDYLYLFDPVSKHLSGCSDTIPQNVGEAWIARRIIGAPEMDKYDHTLSKIGIAHNPVRNWFGTTATAAKPGVHVYAKTFLGSHGALGGVGWDFVIEDRSCEIQVANFMNNGLKRAGIGVKLMSKTNFG